jgi:hypothetical protein
MTLAPIRRNIRARNGCARIRDDRSFRRTAATPALANACSSTPRRPSPDSKQWQCESLGAQHHLPLQEIPRGCPGRHRRERWKSLNGILTSVPFVCDGVAAPGRPEKFRQRDTRPGHASEYGLEEFGCELVHEGLGVLPELLHELRCPMRLQICLAVERLVEKESAGLLLAPAENEVVDDRCWDARAPASSDSGAIPRAAFPLPALHETWQR